jgi:hypothetical protein
MMYDVCHTAILQVNKQICKEARNILYGDNKIRCMFRASGYDDEDPRNFFSWIHVKESQGHEKSMDRVYLGLSQSLDWFRRIQHLRVDLAFCGSHLDNATFRVQTCLLKSCFVFDG